MKAIHHFIAAGFVCVFAGCATVSPTPEAEQALATTTEAVPAARIPATLTLTNTVAANERYSIAGFPQTARQVVLLENTGYAVGFSEELKDPVWAAYYCAPYATFQNEKRPGTFSSDDRVSSTARLKHADYNRPPGNPTYDRGHMAPNYAIATRYGRAAQLETFRMTNVVPQRSTLNQFTWRALEAEIARNFARTCKGVWVTVGPIFKDPITLYNGKAAMPAAFYCIVLDRTDAGKLRALALTMDQSVTGNQRMGDFITTIRDIEQKTGIDFFAALPDDIEDAIEKAKADTEWDWELILNPNKYGKDD